MPDSDRTLNATQREFDKARDDYNEAVKNESFNALVYGPKGTALILVGLKH